MSETTERNPKIVINVSTSTATSFGTQQQDSNVKLCNKPQSNATSAGTIIFISAGMNLAMSLGWSEILYVLSRYYCYCWFIGVIIGAVLSVPLRQFVPKKWIMATAAVLIVIGGILFTSLPQNIDAIFAGRYINGIATGLATITFLMHASEIAVDSYRGTCLSTEQCMISCGIAIRMIYSSYWSYALKFPVNRVHGICDIVLGVIAAVLLFFFIESPIDQIRQGQEADALAGLGRLQRPTGVNVKTHAQLEQHQAYVRQQENLTVGESFYQGLGPLVKMLFFRSLMVSFCYSLPLNITLKYSILFNSYSWAATVAAACRIFPALITMIMIDDVTRKLPSLISVLIMGALLIGLSSIFLDLYSILTLTGVNTVMSLYIVIQAFAGFFTPYTSVYMGEAFPLRVKPHLMAVCVVAEQIIQIIFIETISLRIGDNLLAQGIIMVVVAVFLLLTMPETRNTSLAEAQRRFRKFVYLKMK